MIRKNVAIIGAGPVGLAASMYMEKFGFNYALIERNQAFISHPAAHLLNLRSMETLSEIKCKQEQNKLHELIYQKCEDINYFRYYRYQRRLFDSRVPFYVDDHFYPNPKQKQEEILHEHAFAQYVHLPQPHFVSILKDNIKQKENIYLGHTVLKFKNDKDSVKISLKDHEGNLKQIEADYLIACDGKHSYVRNSLGIGLVGNPYLQSFFNIYFHSKQLAQTLNERNENAMLHFIYNNQVIACLVNHSKKEGMFVLQVPTCPPYDDVSTLDNLQKEKIAYEMIQNLIDPSMRDQINDIDIKTTGMWKLSSEVIEKYYQNRVIFAGDSAHAFPPAGGFGMNTGLQEVHNLAHKLKQIYKYPEHQEKILQTYHDERKQFVTEILNTANKYYKVSLDIAKVIGLNVENYFTFKKTLDVASPFLPKNLQQFLWKTGIKIGSYPAEISDPAKISKKLEGKTVPLIFYKEDTEFKYDKGFISPGKTNQDDKTLSGLLLPHIIINLKDKQIALRQLANYFYENESEREVVYTDKSRQSQNKNLIMVALYKKGFQKEKLQSFIENLDELFVKPDLIVGCEASTNSFYEEKLDGLLKNDKQVILIRSDSIIFGRYEI
ncbi:hypothetical protein ABPG72_010177 [Tetrahymena utriculariae]